MPLFQNSIVTKYLQNQNKANLANQWNLFKNHFLNPKVQEDIKGLKEEQYQGEFLEDLFVKILGYTKPASSSEKKFNLTTEYKNVKDSKKADGAIIVNDTVKAVIELKGTNTTDLGKIESQAFGYKNNQPDCVYVITSNFEKLRFYIDNAIEHIEFNLFTLNQKEFELLYLCLAYDNIEKNIPKRIKEESVSQEDIITKKLYKDYSLFKRELHQNLVALNPQYEPLELFQKSQKLLDRFLFVFFAEDRQLLPTNLIFRINKEWQQLKQMRIEVSLYDRYKMYFEDLNTGAKVSLPAFHETAIQQKEEYQIFAYNGGLFKKDEILNSLKIDDGILFKYTESLSNYDFASEVDVNILGHIFENSLNELDEVKAQLEGQEIDKTKTKRKKDGVFYTPKYITKYIVDNTIGKLCSEKKVELNILEDHYFTDKKRQKKTIKSLVDKLNEYRSWLLQLTICDPACGSGAFLNQALDFLITEHRYIDELQAKLFGDAMVMSDVEKSILENNLFGVDLNEESVEIAKLSLWLRTAQPNRKLNDLNNNIKCGNSLIDNVEVLGDKAFNWKIAFPKIFEKGGFDVIIGNPPYVQIQSMGDIADTLKNQNFKSFERTGDLYCLFYELGNIILKEKGLLGYITSNKWIRANYGKSLRKYLIDKTQPLLLVDLGSGIFESAVVDSNILIFEKSINNKKPFIGLDISKEKNFIDFTIYESQKVKIFPKTDETWSISSVHEQNLKSKIELSSLPLKKWDVKINYGIKTGLNEAFVIDEKTKNELIKSDINCAELLVPILRGRDIQRYFPEFSNLWLINSHNGYGEIPRINIDKYPAIKKHLEKFEPKLSKRSDKGKTSYNLRNCVYIDDFLGEKIMYPNMTAFQPFVFDSSGYFTNDKGYILSSKTCNLKYLLAILNSKFSKYWIRNNCPELQGGTRELRKVFFENYPMLKVEDFKQTFFIDKANIMLSLNLELHGLSQKFQRTIQRKFELDMLPKKLEDWYKLSYPEFIKELGKKKIKLSLSQEAEWEDYFIEESKKALELKATIDATDKAIDKMVYELYELSEEEIAIVENS